MSCQREREGWKGNLLTDSKHFGIGEGLLLLLDFEFVPSVKEKREHFDERGGA